MQKRIRNKVVPKQNKKNVFKKRMIATVAAGAIGAAITAGGIRAYNTIKSRQLNTQRVFIEQFESKHQSRLKHADSWARLSKKYSLNPTNNVHANWIFKINSLSTRINVPPERIIMTIQGQKMDGFTANALQDKINFYKRAIREHEQKISEGNRVKWRQKQIDVNLREIERRKDIIAITRTVMSDKELQEFNKFLANKK